MSVWGGIGIWLFGCMTGSSPNESKEAKDVGRWICRAGIAVGIAGAIRWIIQPTVTTHVVTGTSGSSVVIGPGLVSISAS